MTISVAVIDQFGTTNSFQANGSHTVDGAREIRIEAREDQVTFCQESDDLLVNFDNGDSLRLDGFFSDDGSAAPLLYLQTADGSFAR